MTKTPRSLLVEKEKAGSSTQQVSVAPSQRLSAPAAPSSKQASSSDASSTQKVFASAGSSSLVNGYSPQLNSQTSTVDDPSPRKTIKREIDSSTFIQGKSGLRMVTNFTFRVR